MMNLKKMLSFMMILSIILTTFTTATFAEGADKVMTIDMTQTTGELMQGGTGFLYGMGANDVPSVNLMTAIKPKVIAQKCPDGMQHPSGDVLRVSESFIEAGGEEIQIYMQDAFGVWEYEGTREDVRDTYFPLIREMIPKLMESPYHDYMVCVPYNEPNNIWFSGYMASEEDNGFLTLWKEAYDLIKELDPEMKVAGPNLSRYSDEEMDAFIKFCSENDCMPDVVTWHQLSSPGNVAKNTSKYRAIEEKYGVEEKRVVINEYAHQSDCSSPGELVKWLGTIEDAKVYACLPYWHISNNLNDLAADNNEANGAWQLYKWYSEMSGESLKVATSVDMTEFYGVASLDNAKEKATILFGGADDKSAINLKNIDQTEAFAGAEKVHVNVSAANWTAFHGAVYEPELVLDGTYEVVDGELTIELSGIEASSAYNLTITPAGESDEVERPFVGAWRKTYSASEAEILGGAAVSEPLLDTYITFSDKIVTNFTTPEDGIVYNVNVPQNGRYKLDIIYGNGVGSNVQNMDEHAPKIAEQILQINDGEGKIIELPSTLGSYMEGMYTEYVDLTAGDNSIKITGAYPEGIKDGELAHDAIYLTYDGAYGEGEREFSKIYQAYTGDYNEFNGVSSAITLDAAIDGYTGLGYIKGLNINPVKNGGGVRFVVNVEKNGLYNVGLRYASEEEGVAGIYVGNTARTFDSLVKETKIENTDNTFAMSTQTVFLERGVNIVDIDASVDIALDYIKVSKASGTEDKTITVEAEEGELSGTTTGSSKYASGAAYVEGIKANEEDGEDNYLKIIVNVPETGEYAMSIYQSCGEIFGNHEYNAKLVNRYASVQVNDGEPVCYDFRNTYSDEMFKTKTVKVTLNEGENATKIFNDNSFIIKRGNIVKNEIIELENYTPNFDKFEFTPVALENAALEEEKYSIKITTTADGYVETNKDYVLPGESATLKMTSNYGIKDVIVDGRSVFDELEFEGYQRAEYEISNVASDVEAFVIFEEDKPSEISALCKSDGRISVSVPYETGSIIAAKYSENDVLEDAKTVDIDGGGEYIIEGWQEGDVINIFAWDGLDTIRPYTKSLSVEYKQPRVDLYEFSGSEYDSFFDSESGEALESGTGLNGFGTWFAENKTRTYSYVSGSGDVYNYTFTRGLKAGRGGIDTSNVYFVPEEDGAATVLFDAGTDRCMYVEQDGEIVQKYGEGSGSLTALEVPVKKGTPVYIYGGGANKVLYAVIFDNLK